MVLLWGIHGRGLWRVSNVQTCIIWIKGDVVENNDISFFLWALAC